MTHTVADINLNGIYFSHLASSKNEAPVQGIIKSSSTRTVSFPKIAELLTDR